MIKIKGNNKITINFISPIDFYRNIFKKDINNILKYNNKNLYKYILKYKIRICKKIIHVIKTH